MMPLDDCKSLLTRRHELRDFFIYVPLLVLALLATSLAHSQDKGAESYQTKAVQIQRDGYGEQLGTVSFPISCSQIARRDAERGLALLHHMTYDGARAAFSAATKADPNCAMGYWGMAMSFIHPVWSDQPSQTNFERGQSFINKAKRQGQKNDWEQAYISAVEAYYAIGRHDNEKANLISFEKAWERVYQQFPKDTEAASFYALAHMAVADPANKQFTRQQHAAAIAKQVLARIPNHPGAHHYIIHALDYPSLAQDALAVARSYGEIATNVPHALHMPSHIFTRLGLWEESIVMNQRAVAASLANPLHEKISLHYLHALDYLVYAFLQRGDDERAQEALDIISSLKHPIQRHRSSAYTLASIPARIALENKQWAEASMLRPRMQSKFPWDEFPAMEAITYFVRALGAARSANEEMARQALDQFIILHDRAAKKDRNRTKQMDIQRLTVQAWLFYHADDPDKALEMMRKAAKMETAMDKQAFSSGIILPALELYADMLLEAGHYRSALSQYQASLVQHPNRFNSLYGAARAAELAEDKNQARFFYQKLMKISITDTKRLSVQQARSFLEKN